MSWAGPTCSLRINNHDFLFYACFVGLVDGSKPLRCQQEPREDLADDDDLPEKEEEILESSEISQDFLRFPPEKNRSRLFPRSLILKILSTNNCEFLVRFLTKSFVPTINTVSLRQRCEEMTFSRSETVGSWNCVPLQARLRGTNIGVFHCPGNTKET